MKRFRWYSLSPVSQSSLKRIVEGMRKEEFGQDSTVGFLISRARTDLLEAKFVERMERSETLQNPFGDSEELHRVEYHVTHFRLSVEPPQLEFYDCSRSVSPAINSLTAIMGGESVVRPLEVDVAKWLAVLENQLSDTRVIAAFIGRLSLSESVNAKVVLKGSEDVRRFAKEIVGARAYKFERLEVSATFQGFPIRFELKEDGRATLKSGDEDFLDILRRSLVEVL